MTIAHSQTLICSTLRFSEILKYYGKADIVSLSTIKLIYKLLDNPYMTIEFEQRRILEEMAVDIQMNNSNICTLSPYSLIQAESSEDEEAQANRPPTISDNSVNYDADYYTFKLADFILNFADADGDSYETLRIKTLPANGELTYYGVVISAGYELPLTTVEELVYTQVQGETIDTLTFQVSDNNTNKLFSNMATFTINIDQVINQPPDTVGVNTFNLNHAGTIVFAGADFTTGTTPPYSDPDGDLAESIKITALPTQGILKLNGINVVANDIISIATINTGVFTYIANPLNTATYDDTFYFSVSDVGSHLFTAGGEMTGTIAAFVNLPPDVVGDGERTVEEGYVITFTRADFTTNTTPPYHDPENDVADKLKIITVPTTGDIKLNGVVVIDNDVINFSSIDSGLLTYVQDPGAGGTTPVFSFQIADAGSGTFVG